MDIDMATLKAVVVDKGLSLQTVVGSIEQALLAAYHHTEGHQQQARVELDRKTGHVTVWAAELDDQGLKVGEYDDPRPTSVGSPPPSPSRSSCSACAKPPTT